MAPLPKPPGQRVVKRMSTRTKWLILAPVSLMLVGYGLCVFYGAGQSMQQGVPFTRWFVEGTYSLVLINGGLSLLGQAIRFRVMMDTRRIIRRELRKRDKQRPKKKKAPSGNRSEA